MFCRVLESLIVIIIPMLMIVLTLVLIKFVPAFPLPNSIRTPSSVACMLSRQAATAPPHPINSRLVLQCL